MNQTKKGILTKNAPAPIGPYQQAVEVNGFVFCSGQIALDPQTGTLSSDKVEGQTEQVMKNLEAVLKEADLTFEHVVKTTIFLKNMNDFPKVNELYGKYFKNNPPARATVEVSRLPKDVLVEIDAIAAR